jgi:UDP-N-acetylbacillosamine transaminase
LRVAGVGAGERVLVSDFTFIGSVAPILYQGATPIFIDSDFSWNIDPNLIEDAIKKEFPKALIIVHLYGQSCDMEPILELCDRYGVELIEDSAESLGTKYKNIHSGTFGRFGAVSFNGNKIITTSGGGALLCRSKKDYQKAKKLSTQAKENTLWYEHKEIGYNYRMSNILAAIGVGQMEILEQKIAKKREIFKSYQEEFREFDEVEFMPEIDGSFGSRWLTTLTFKKSNPFKIIEALSKENIESRPLWKPMHLQPLFRDAKVYGGSVSKRLFESGICLPSGTKLSQEDIKRVSSIVKQCLK